MGTRGGARPGGGRPKKVDEQKAVNRIITAMKVIFNKEDEEEAVNAFLVDFGKSRDGKKFFAEHVLGKPKEQIDMNVNDVNVKPIEWTKKK